MRYLHALFFMSQAYIRVCPINGTLQCNIFMSTSSGPGTGIQCPVSGRRTNLLPTGRTFCRFISPLTEAGVFSAIMIKTMCMYSPVNDFQQGRPFLHGDSLQQQVRRIRGYSLYPTLVIKSAVVAASFAWFSMFFFSGPPMII